jgi:NTP pyrophosphatase (non-canonical NTP hydrolase)
MRRTMFAIGDEEWPGLSKLAEECGEVLQVIGKLMGTRGEEIHWDGQNLTESLLDEMADLRAAIDFVLEHNPFTGEQKAKYYQRYSKKMELFEDWHAHEDPPPPQNRAEALERLEG